MIKDKRNKWTEENKNIKEIDKHYITFITYSNIR